LKCLIILGEELNLKNNVINMFEVSKQL